MPDKKHVMPCKQHTFFSASLINVSVLSEARMRAGVIGAAELWRAFDKTV
jgi:hypothetical protein